MGSYGSVLVWMALMNLVVSITCNPVTEEDEDLEDEKKGIVYLQVEQGVLNGKIFRTVIGKMKYVGFLGVPYAKPPVGKLRFKAPQVPDPWPGVRKAHVEGNNCPQKFDALVKYSGDEDCLYLNIYTPQFPRDAPKPLRPVMVYIHGGAFIGGSGGKYRNGPDYFVLEDVVMVSMNYRLGVLGFMSLNSPEVCKNAGLKDQVMALMWIRENIAHFGGDPGRVTIFGESAGAASVHYHLLSPMSKGLFHGAIAQSGVSLNPWAFREPSNNSALMVAEWVGCSGNDPQEVVQCLTETPADQLVKKFSMYRPQDVESLMRYVTAFVPTLEEEDDVEGDVFLPGRPLQLLLDGKFHKVPFVAGLTAEEGLAFIDMVFRLPKLTTMFYTALQRLILRNLGYEPGSERASMVLNKVHQFYFSDEPVTVETLYEYVHMSSDVLFGNGIDTAVKIQASLSDQPVYYYQFSFDGEFVHAKDYPGVAHADDLSYIFPTHEVRVKDYVDSPEHVTSYRLVKLWTNFAKTGNPSSEVNALLNVTWIPVSKDAVHFLKIGVELDVGQNVEKKRMEFWDDIFKEASKDYKI